MSAAVETAVREPSLISFADHQPLSSPGLRRWTARAQNIRVDCLRGEAGGAGFEHASSDETMLIVLRGPVTIAGVDAAAGAASAAGTGAAGAPAAGSPAAASSGAEPSEAPARSVCILPPGRWRLQPAAGTDCVVLSSLRGGSVAEAINDGAYAPPDARIKPVGRPYTSLNGERVRIMAIDQIKAPADNPRLKMLQTATMSINWVEYEGERDSSALSPHSHADFEQGSLALAGDFVHHLRTPWGRNAREWRDDQHPRLPSPSLMVVPVGMIHTSEGVGGGHHLLIDLFSPPRADFIAKGWMANAADYRAPDAA
ncbi:MAG: hypothetical protein AB7L76_16565 [Burkholderiaceae bacterium]